MGTKTQLYITVDGTDCDVAPADRFDLTLEEATRVEQLAGIPFFSVRTGDPTPMPLWTAMLIVQVQRTLPDVAPAKIRALTIGDLKAREVDDGQPDLAAVDGGQAPDPTDGEATSDGPSPDAEPSTSGPSPTS